ncbi:hypothetical protein H4R21_001330 [Coemansia helicoidea]|uniref:Uncharacterized protein n=1 Tax=Coemansia helicoidea TaxID=1286919 RepID=A0ACC1LCB6_9FUNG|nr:hypothetical protein H4R21_001330 [Coemansia helicoidea]
MIIFFIAVYAFDLVVVAFILYNRNYPPMRCKSPILMAGIIVSAILWFVGDVQVNGHVPLLGTPWNNCKAFGMWINVVLGVCMVSALLALRTLGLMRVFIMGQPFRGRGLYLPLLLYTVCLLIFGTVVQVIPAKKTFYYLDVVDVCYCTNGLMAAIYAAIWLTWVGVVILSWRLRTIKSSFNEAREAAVGCFVVFALLTTATVMHYALPNFPLNATHRILTTSFDHVSTQIFWWIIMGVPVFNCLFRREQYLNEWTLKLLNDGLQDEYDVTGSNGSEKAAIVQQSGDVFPSDTPLDFHCNDANAGISRLEIPITDNSHSAQHGGAISWPHVAENHSADQPNPGRRRFRRW